MRINVSGRFVKTGINDSANLDLLRSAAVLLVFCVHFYDIWTGTGRNSGFVWHLGQLGVLMFFVHTCLVLMWSLERSNLEGWPLFASFYTRRLFRLYPLSVVCVLLAYCFDARWTPANLWQNLTLTQYLFFKAHPTFPPILTPLWSLPLEVQMYLVLPVFFLIFRDRPVKDLAMLWIVCSAMAIAQPELGERLLILRYVPCFLGGVIAWSLTRKRNDRDLPAWLWPIAIAIVSINWIMASGEYLPLGIAIFGLLLGLAIPRFREIRWSPLIKASNLIARYSYGIYLAHFPIMVFVLSGAGEPRFRLIYQFPRLKHYARPVNFCSVIGLTVLASLALYHLIEGPGIRLGKKIARWMTPYGVRWVGVPALVYATSYRRPLGRLRGRAISSDDSLTQSDRAMLRTRT